MLSGSKKAILAVLGLFVATNLYQYNSKCSHTHFNSMCEDFNDGGAVGGICNAICDSKRFQIEKCFTTSEEKQVFSALLDGQPVMLKHLKPWKNDMKKWENKIAGTQNFHQKNKMDIHAKEELSMKVVGELENFLLSRFGDCSNFDQLLGTFFALGDLDKDGYLDVTEGSSLLSHLENNEFLMLVLLQGGQFTLKFHGFCGGFYLVEKVVESTQNVYGFMDPLSEGFAQYFFPLFLEPIEDQIEKLIEPIESYFTTLKLYHSLQMWVYQSFFESRTPNWQERFNFTYGLLDILRYFQDVPYGPVHYCDIHTANIGLTAKRTYKILDYDLLLPQYYAAELVSQVECEEHKDCTVGDHVDCKGFCDKNTGFCKRAIIPHDLWHFCNTIIASSLVEHPPGFLGYRPLEDEMKQRGKLIKNALTYCYQTPLTRNKEQILRNILAVKEKFKQVEELNE